MRFTEPMNELIKVRVGSDEKRRLVAVARQRGMTLSDYVRQTATEAARREQRDSVCFPRHDAHGALVPQQAGLPSDRWHRGRRESRQSPWGQTD